MNSFELFVIILFWMSWCVLHSAMISLSVTSYLKRRLGESFKYYRLFFNVTSLLTLIPLYLVSLNMKGELIFSWSGGLRVLQLTVFACSLLFFILGAKHYDLANFLGFSQITSGKNNAVMSESGKLDTSGILGITRHPWYLGGLMLIWSSHQDLYTTKFWINIVLSGYFIIGTLLEERKLRCELGQSYIDYSRQVSMLFPFKWLQTKLSHR